MSRVIGILFLLFYFLEAKEYKIDLVLDSSSKVYEEQIKEELKSFFAQGSKLKYKIEYCKNDCISYVKNKKRRVFLLKDDKGYKEQKNKYIVSYNGIYSEYDKNRVVRTLSLAIYEFLVEKKAGKSLYIKNILISNPQKKEEKSTSHLDIEKVFKYVQKRNLELLQNQNSIKIDFLNKEDAKANLLPNVELFSNYIKIDSDRAIMGNSEGTLEAGVKLKQLIYSKKVIDNIKIRNYLNKALINSVDNSNDEIIYKALLTYLNIIKAKKYNDIIKIKQNFIKQNLKFAKQRVEIGVRDRSDIYRWRSELSNANIDLAESKKDLNVLKVELGNMLLIDDKFSFDEYGMNSEIFKILGDDAIKYIEDKRVQELFVRDIIYEHSLLKQLDELIKAKKSELGINKASKYMPTLSLEASAKKILDRYENGANSPRSIDDEDFQLVLNMSFNLFEGGKKDINIQRSELELINLKLKYQQIKNLINENVQRNYDSLQKSYEKIYFAKDSANTSKKSFELTQDKYKNGNENIISLIDAQNAYIVSKLNLNISIVEYLTDICSIYFFSGNIDILFDEARKKEVEEKILNEIGK